MEVDETYIGSPGHGGKRGRGTSNKVLAAIAVEVSGGKAGRMRAQAIGDASALELHGFIGGAVEKGSTLVTDGWEAYNGIEAKGYFREVSSLRGNPGKALPHVHTVVSLLKRWLLGTLQGACSAGHMPYYLDEYTFRFNRRTSRHRGMLFYRLLQNAVQLEPVTYHSIARRK